MSIKHSILLTFTLFLCGISMGQGLKQMEVRKAVDEIIVDGEMNEESWKSADVASGFFLNFPNDTASPSLNTEVRATFDDKAIYFFGIMRDSTDLPFVIESLRRDWNFLPNDNFSIYFDPFNDKTTGFSFGMSPFGVQREGLMFEGSSVTTDWDNIWYSEAKIEDDFWTVEVKIPFKSIRYNKDSEFWNVIFLRNDRKNNEVSTWTPVPQEFSGSNLGYSGTMNFLDPLPKPGMNLSVIPYVAGRAVRNYEDDESINELELGGDAKVGISPSLNLDLTVNPDFSQVEVDRQVTNLDRFELFFPERRQFFLENDDLFGRFGFPRSRVFFSRRIGLDRPILYGARLSGKASDNLRVGFLNMQEGGNQFDTLNNATVAVFQRKVFARSNISGIFANRQGYRPFADTTRGTGFLMEDYNRSGGLEYNLLSADNRWSGDIYYFRSFTPGKNSNNFGHSAFIGYRSRNLFIGYSQDAIGENYQLDLGFLPRTGYYRFGPNFRYTFFTNKDIVLRHGPNFSYNVFTNQDWRRTDQVAEFSYNVTFKNTSAIDFAANNLYIQLQDTFIIGFDENSRDTLLPFQEFEWQEFGIAYNTDTRKVINAGIGINYGGFFNAERYNVTSFLNMRFQPFAAVGIQMDYNYLNLSGNGTDKGNLLVSPRLDLTLSKKIFLTTFVQYNEQINNFNINSRLQWRFKPVSDFFIVYTENYFSDSFRAKSRALVFKLTYWLNV